MKSWGFNFTELLSLELIWDWTSYENIILCTDKWVIILFKIPYLSFEWNKYKWRTCVLQETTDFFMIPSMIKAQEMFLFSNLMFSCFTLKKLFLRFECENRISQQGQYSKCHRKRSTYHKQCRVLKKNSPKWLRGL